MKQTIDKKALLVISFGTSYAETRKKTITATETVLAQSFPDYDLRRAFTSKMVIRKLRERDDIHIDTVPQAIEKIAAAGYTEVLAQPLLVINGTEFDELSAELAPYTDQFTRFHLGRPLLTSQQDYLDVVASLKTEFPVGEPDEAVVLMGHGSEHPANSAYAALDYVFKDQGFPYVYIATVEGFPFIKSVIKRLEADRIKKVTLMPFMLVAGDHAQNDMAGDDEESWKTILERKGFAVETRLTGLGEIEKIHQIYIEHARIALESMNA